MASAMMLKFLVACGEVISDKPKPGFLLLTDGVMALMILRYYDVVIITHANACLLLLPALAYQEKSGANDINSYISFGATFGGGGPMATRRSCRCLGQMSMVHLSGEKCI